MTGDSGLERPAAICPEGEKIGADERKSIGGYGVDFQEFDHAGDNDQVYECVDHANQ